ncbi:MAG TPA: hypothetical protein VFQ91_10135 [Bryobacteraceae bacterium]|nr:hypothetical protein [Bryobacteraceae bacterium]
MSYAAYFNDTDPGAGLRGGGDGQGSGGGGDGGSGVVSIGNLKKEGEEYLKVQDAFALTLANLDRDCNNFLNSSDMDVTQYVSDLFANDLVVVGQAPSAIAAFTNSGGTDIAAGYAAMVCSTNSAFFIGGLRFKVNAGKINGGTYKATVFIILYELGHAVSANGFQNDFGNNDAGKANDKMIEKECKKTLDRIKCRQNR